MMEALTGALAIVVFLGLLYLNEGSLHRHVVDPPHVHSNALGQYGKYACDSYTCKARYIEAEGLWDDDPMYQLRKLQDEVDDLIEKPLKDEFAKLQAKVEAREYVDMYWSVPKIPIPRAVFTQPEEEDKSGVSPEERARESLLNDDIAI